MIYVTGDMHADATRLKSRAAKQLKKQELKILIDFIIMVINVYIMEKLLMTLLKEKV